ncbi:hypothetical protein AYO20_05189 [Fonsecaea nubica]|uniref:Uncharacterized protein n=1 Tax=Fonsecaea nubica TaxID=856822 RepID=A0A178D081_9EURO|nr:hypothetical protein AYO20_05189 [Fonsecaea nubica]OAL35570.1 hypothetical protein AYO20_05189 [Fonsecaea nubica]
MSGSPSKKRTTKPIHEFFKPYLKSTVPAKRPSPSAPERKRKEAESSRRDDTNKAAPTTPRAGKRTIDHYATRTPPSTVLSPRSAPGSRTSLSIRSRTSHSKDPIEPPSTYKRAPRFDAVALEEEEDGDTSKGQANRFSFSDLTSSTQTVVKDGKVIEVLDSDEDDKDSLESLEDLFGRKKDGRSTSLSSGLGAEAKAEAERIRMLNLFTSGRSVPLVGSAKIRALRAKEMAHKFDISGLMDDHFNDKEVESKVSEARADFEAAAQAASGEGNLRLDRTLLAAMATTDDDEHKVARVMDAFDRTEALASEPVFLVFGVKGLNDWHDQDPYKEAFPKDAIPEHLWREGDDDSRSRAYVSGYMADLAARGLISDDVLNWTYENVIIEPQDDLRQAYIQCLKIASSSWTRTNINSQAVTNVFGVLGADDTSLLPLLEIKRRHRLLKEPVPRDPKYLLAILDLYHSICADMDFSALSNLTSIICRLAIDSELTSDGRISSSIEAMLERLLSLPDVGMRSFVADRVVSDMGQYLKDATLQAQLLSHILPTSPTALQVRILLSQIFLLGFDKTKGTGSSAPKISLQRLAEHVSKSPDFDTRRRKGPSTIDYAALRARTHILDIAISDGGRPAEFASRADEASFNKSVDHLANAVEATLVAIIDTGASHMTRTECKDVLHALYWRLLYSVRTESRPKRHIFDGKAGKLRDAEELRVEERGKDFMSRFLEKTKEKQRKRDKGAEKTTSREDGEMSPRKSGKSLPSTSPPTSDEPSETEKSIRRQLGLDD